MGNGCPSDIWFNLFNCEMKETYNIFGTKYIVFTLKTQTPPTLMCLSSGQSSR